MTLTKLGDYNRSPNFPSETAKETLIYYKAKDENVSEFEHRPKTRLRTPRQLIQHS